MGRLLCTMLHNDVLSDIKLTFSRGVKRMQSLLSREQYLCRGSRGPLELATSFVAGLGSDSRDFENVSNSQLYIR